MGESEYLFVFHTETANNLKGKDGRFVYLHGDMVKRD